MRFVDTLACAALLAAPLAAQSPDQDEARLRARLDAMLLQAGRDGAKEHGPTDNFGAFVQRQLAAGKRGRELAAAIRAEHQARGKGKPVGVRERGDDKPFDSIGKDRRPESAMGKSKRPDDAKSKRVRPDSAADKSRRPF